MTSVRVLRYGPEHERMWNELVAASRNGTFLFDRRYMDYHGDRFPDHSLILFDDDGRPIALLPAHVHTAKLVSHGGLTYGGFVVGTRATLTTLQRCFDDVADYLRANALSSLVYKTVPHIYHRQPAEEDRHALFLRNARVHRRDVLLVIDNAERGPMQERRRRGAKRAARAGLLVEESDDFGPYWDVLTENLQSKYGCGPVHSLSEITLLASRFPQQIRLTVCRDADRVLAGVVVYVSERVAHLQYIGSSAAGREQGALDAVMEWLIARWSDRRYFDFGAATEQDGRYVNAGLLEFKEGWGARTIVHDFYTLDVDEERS